MSNKLNRRAFTKTLLAGVGAAALPALISAQAKKLQIGATSLIWGAVPRTPENLEPALKDMLELGYYKAETFAQIIEDWHNKGTMKALQEKYPIPLISAFHSVELMNTSTRKENLEELVRRGKILRQYGGRFMVLNANGVKRPGYNFAEHRATIVASLNEYAKAMNDIGLGAGLHQHTGTAIDLTDEVYAVMENVDTRYLKFAPDTGQLQKSGSDAAKVVKDFAAITVHMHLKDWKGWEHMGGYVPLGEGKVDLKSILETVEKANPTANVMHELDGSANMPYTPRQTAEISKKYLQSLGYAFRT
jgi:inosose dehydratase